MRPSMLGIWRWVVVGVLEVREWRTWDSGAAAQPDLASWRRWPRAVASTGTILVGRGGGGSTTSS